MRETTEETCTLQTAKLEPKPGNMFISSKTLGSEGLEMLFKYGTQRHLFPKCKI